jgi:holo-[acyl-carrier protein] synthase
MCPLRSGIDLVEVKRMGLLQESIRNRFLERVFTAAELEYARGSDMHLAGRFAAKEAVAKALGSGIGPVSWQEIEILNNPVGEPVLYLHGNAKKMAEDLGLEQWSVSISHTNEYAVAVAVASA